MQEDKVKRVPKKKEEAAGLKKYLMDELATNFASGLKGEKAICDQVKTNLVSYLDNEHPDPQEILCILCGLEKSMEEEG